MPAGQTQTVCRLLTLIAVVCSIAATSHAQETAQASISLSSPDAGNSTATVQQIKPTQNWPVKKPVADHSVRRFRLLTASVYAAATLDMQESLSLRPGFHEDDPLGKPMAHLPAPAYYTTGYAFATGVNLVGWKMARSERWRSVWWLPQIGSIAGNLVGFGYTKAHEHTR